MTNLQPTTIIYRAILCALAPIHAYVYGWLRRGAVEDADGKKHSCSFGRRGGWQWYILSSKISVLLISL